MRVYESGQWGFCLIWGIKASVFPRALAVAIPNAVLAWLLASFVDASKEDQSITNDAWAMWAGFSAVLFFVLNFRSNVAYNRWWEGGTLLQQTRGEWFNAYSSLVAFTTADPKREKEVEAFHHMLARLMSLLFSSALQQVSPNHDRCFEILVPEGLDPLNLEFMAHSGDKVEVILQWVQRSTILNMTSGVLSAPPPVMSRAFQELSRGIVNLQNARKIADFPFPFPYAQTSIVMLLIHWVMCPVLASVLLTPNLAAATCFAVVFFLWCMNFIALSLESPFGSYDNDLPMEQMQQDWNKSLVTLLHQRATQPPKFTFTPDHREVVIAMSDGAPSKRLKSVYAGDDDKLAIEPLMCTSMSHGKEKRSVSKKAKDVVPVSMKDSTPAQVEAAAAQDVKMTKEGSGNIASDLDMKGGGAIEPPSQAMNSVSARELTALQHVEAACKDTARAAEADKGGATDVIDKAPEIDASQTADAAPTKRPSSASAPTGSSPPASGTNKNNNKRAQDVSTSQRGEIACKSTAPATDAIATAPDIDVDQAASAILTKRSLSGSTSASASPQASSSRSSRRGGSASRVNAIANGLGPSSGVIADCPACDVGCFGQYSRTWKPSDAQQNAEGPPMQDDLRNRE